MALRFWKTAEDALGNKIDNESGWIGTIIGVVGDVHHFDLAAPVRDEYYYPVSQAPHYGLGGTNIALGTVLVVRAADAIDPETRIGSLLQKIAEIDSTVPLSRVSV